MNRFFTRRIEELEKRQPTKPGKVAIIGEFDLVPEDAGFVIRICAAPFPSKEDCHA